MPYIVSRERPAIDRIVDALARALAKDLTRRNGTTDLSVCYGEAFAAISDALRRISAGRPGKVRTPAEKLALEVFANREKDAAWLGRLNYAVTRLIQSVPKKMVEGGSRKEEFRYWVYAETVGALTRAAMSAHQAGGGSVAYGLVGVFTDVKDEYKRRVNSAYEAVQIARSGDCYSTPYRTELTKVRGAGGRVVGYQEVMKDFRV